MTLPHLPPDTGVIWWQGQPVVYRFVDGWAEKVVPGAAGGEMRIRYKTGRKDPEAQALGESILLEMSPELRAAIEADVERGRS
jgi:hypothetical protein